MTNDEQDSEDKPFHMEGNTPIFDRPQNVNETAHDRREREAHEFARSQVATNRLTTWFNGFLVFATFATAAIGIWQGVISRKAANAATEAAKAAKDSINATNQSAYAACIGAKVAIDTLNEEKSSAALSRATGMATIFQSEATLRSQTANVIARFPETTFRSDAAGTRVVASEVFTNFGNTPAYDIHFISTVKVLESEKMTSFAFPAGESATGHIPTMLQGESRPLPSEKMQYLIVLKDGSRSSRLMSLAEMQQCREQKLFFGVISRVTYRDVFGIRHWSQTCEVVYNKAADVPGTFASHGDHRCEAYNRSDNASVLEKLPLSKPVIPEPDIICKKPLERTD